MDVVSELVSYLERFNFISETFPVRCIELSLIDMPALAIDLKEQAAAGSSPTSRMSYYHLRQGYLKEPILSVSCRLVV